MSEKLTPYEEFLQAEEAFDQRIEELQEELVDIENKIEESETDYSESIVAEALGESKSKSSSIRNQMKKLKDRKEDVTHMIEVVKEQKESTMNKLIEKVTEYFRSTIQAKIVQEAEAQIKEIKRAKARYLHEISKLGKINRKSGDAQSEFNRLRYKVGDDKFMYARGFGIEYDRGWDSYFKTGTTEIEIREATQGRLHSEVAKLLEQ